MEEILDYRGLKCPQPILRFTLRLPSLPAGASVTLLADCDTFPDDIRKCCADMGKVLVSLDEKDGGFVAVIQI